MNSTKERIIQESAVLFARNGCKTITMDDIASSLGMSKRTIYENFSDKKDLLSHCMQYFLMRGHEEVEKVLQSTDNVIEAMFQTAQCTSDLMRNVKHNLFQEILKYYPDVHASTVQIFKEKNIDISRRMMAKGQADGVFRTDLDPYHVSLLIQVISSHILHLDLFAPVNKELMATLFMYNFSRGMATEKGLKILDKFLPAYIENIKKLS